MTSAISAQGCKSKAASRLSSNFFAIFSISLLYVYLTFFCWGRVTDIIIDRGFEIYLAWRMNHGEMPIRDYYLLVPPASYQINALLFRIFGENLSVLLSAGILNGFVFVLLLFAVLSRVTTVLSAWSIAISAILVTIFSDSIFNFILPYTFAMPYASSAFMGSLLALLAFVDGGKRSRLLWSGFLYGLSVCLKYEFVLFGAVVFITPFATRFKLRYWLIQTLLCAAAPMILSLVLLTAEGVGLHDWARFIEWFRSFVSSPLLAAFYKRVGVYSFDPLIRYFPAALSNFMVFALVVSVWVYTDRSRMSSILKVLTFVVILAKCILISWDRMLGFLWLGIASLGVSLVAISSLTFIPRMAPGGGKSLIVLVSFLLAGVKTMAAPAISLYGSIFWPYYWGAIVVSLGLLREKSGKSIFIGLGRGVPVILVATSVSLFQRYTLPSVAMSDTPLLSQQEREDSAPNHSDVSIDTIRAPRSQVEVAKSFIEVINRRRKSDSSLLVLPEGTMLNFILRMPGAAGFHNLMPTFFFSYGEDFLVDKIKTSSPHFILVNQDTRSEHAPYETFGVDYAKKISSEIVATYCKVPSSYNNEMTSKNAGFQLWSKIPEDCDTP